MASISPITLAAIRRARIAFGVSFDAANITRNLTAVLAIILAVWLRSREALFVALAARFVTDIVDATTVYTMNATYLKSAVPMVVALLIISAAIGMVYLWKSMKRT